MSALLGLALVLGGVGLGSGVVRLRRRAPVGRVALDIVHGEIGLSVDHAGVVHGQDVGVPQPGRRAGLAEEPFDAF